MRVLFDDNGKVKDAKSLIKALKEEWAEHVLQKSTQGAEVPNPPAGGGAKYKSADEIMKITDDAERQRAIAENHELFGY